MSGWVLSAAGGDFDAHTSGVAKMWSNARFHGAANGLALPVAGSSAAALAESVAVSPW